MVAYRWKFIILATLAACMAAGLLATFLIKPKYTATTLVEIAREGSRIAPIQGVERETSDADLEFYQTQFGLLRSTSLAERVVRQLGLQDNRAFFSAFGKRPAGETLLSSDALSLLPTAREDRVRQAAGILLLNLDIAPVRLSRLVDISVTAPDPKLSARVANAWAENFIASTLERRYDATSYARTFLERRLGQLRQNLETSERALVAYASRERIINIPGAGAAAGERSIVADDLATLNAALNEATADRVKAQARLRDESGGASLEALQSSAISGLRQRRAELASDYQKLLVQFEPDYPAARALKAQLDQLDRSISREEGRVSSTIRGQYGDSLRREQQLKERVSSLQEALLDQRRRSIQYQIIQREADTNRQLYDALLQRYKEIGVASGVGVNNISVVDEADVPVRPSSPKLLLNLLLSFIAGVAGSAALVFLLEQTADSFDDPDKVERELRIPLLGTVPLVTNGAPIDLMLDPKSTLFEAYLSVETSLGLTTEHGVPRTLAITSTRPAEGKSLTSLALATLLARSGRRVLLMDGDMRSPSVAEAVSLSNDQGLSNYLSGQDDWESLIAASGVSGLEVMPAGPIPPNAAQLLSGDRFAGLLAQLVRRFDHVVVDSPPVVGLADAPLIGNAVDGVLMAVESHGIRATLVRRALNRLLAARVPVIGAVLTKFRSDRAGLGFGYDYGYGYGRAGGSPSVS